MSQQGGRWLRKTKAVESGNKMKLIDGYLYRSDNESLPVECPFNVQCRICGTWCLHFEHKTMKRMLAETESNVKFIEIPCNEAIVSCTGTSKTFILD